MVEGAGLPAEVAQTIARANAQIEQSGAACGLVVGDTAPEFVLFGADGHQVRLSERLAEGPVIVSLDRHGVIRARYVSSDYTTRMEPDEIISALTALAR